MQAFLNLCLYCVTVFEDKTQVIARPTRFTPDFDGNITLKICKPRQRSPGKQIYCCNCRNTRM